ncbi:dihydropteroate synthase [Hasllibacter halocynthiae]|uniref:Dihydropteroate synthase n=1 Tax=Hasllibacter halocynthiae TaxID=595589 RepID=A0A2T0X6E2_9RHOB|nr:dihydropteroate synthase [Hasllibacter halocynthiae]PRY94493.1 dihydropteroate synthase [Hasllibacter halocynthiae]
MRLWTPIPLAGPDPAGVPLAGGPARFAHAIAPEGEVVPARAMPAEVLRALSVPRAAPGGGAPAVWGILNVTPDSFSDGGRFDRPEAALAQAAALARVCDVIDIGGESTRPGAAEVPEAEEIARTAPVIEAIRSAGITTPISIDTRKAAVAEAALAAGAGIVNDVSAGRFDPDLLVVSARTGAGLVLMHSVGTPETMQDDPCYDDVLGEVAAHLAERLEAARTAGVAADRVLLDPGIGFGKTQAHNIALLRGLPALHVLGRPLLLGASRKRFIGVIGNAPEAADRAPGSIAVALRAALGGVQALRVHDAAMTAQALALWRVAGLKEEVT